jgi:hypothetical protein
VQIASSIGSVFAPLRTIAAWIVTKLRHSAGGRFLRAGPTKCERALAALDDDDVQHLSDEGRRARRLAQRAAAQALLP